MTFDHDSVAFALEILSSAEGYSATFYVFQYTQTCCGEKLKEISEVDLCRWLNWMGSNKFEEVLALAFSKMVAILNFCSMEVFTGSN